MQNAALEAIGCPLRYEALDVAPDALSAVLDRFVAGNVAGNVTIPHKARVASACARLSAAAGRARAVNVFWVEDGTLAGDNTDIPAFAHLAALTLGTPPADLRIAVLGAGGAASAVLAAIEQWPGCRVSLFNRTRERADTLAARFPVVTAVAGSPDDAVAGAALIVNASALGLHGGDPLPVDVARLARDAAVVDRCTTRRAAARGGSGKRPPPATAPATAWRCCSSRERSRSSAGWGCRRPGR